MLGKINAIILLVVLTLITKPALSFYSTDLHEQQSCCADACGNDAGEKQDNNCNDNACNPFQSCSSCVWLFSISNTSFNLNANLYHPNFSVGPPLHVLQKFSSDFWHPPKV